MFEIPPRLEAVITPALLPLAIWIFFEALFFLYFKNAQRRLSRRKAPCHLAQTSQEREKLLRDCINCIQRSDFTKRPVDLCKNLIRGWFFQADLDRIKRGNLLQWLSWAYFDKLPDEMKTEDEETILKLVEIIEQAIDHKFSEGFDPNLLSMRTSIDPMYSTPMPLALYGAVMLARGAGAIFVQYFGFQYRTMTVGNHTLPYFFRPGPPHWKSGGAEPLLFLPGLGGLVTYIRILPSISRNVPVFLIDLPHVSMVLGSEQVMSVPDTVKCLQLILAAEEMTSACFVGHSFGTAITTWVLKKAPSLVSSMVLIDPIVFLLCEPTVAHSFLYRSPATFPQMILFFCARELYISHTIARNFSWSHSILFIGDIPKKQHKSFIFLSSKDALIPAHSIRSYLKPLYGTNTEVVCLTTAAYYCLTSTEWFFRRFTKVAE